MPFFSSSFGNMFTRYAFLKSIFQQFKRINKSLIITFLVSKSKLTSRGFISLTVKRHQRKYEILNHGGILTLNLPRTYNIYSEVKSCSVWPMSVKWRIINLYMKHDVTHMHTHSRVLDMT